MSLLGGLAQLLDVLALGNRHLLVGTHTGVEVHRNAGAYFNRHAIQHGRLVAPLLHSFQRSLNQQRVSPDHPQIFHRTLLVDNRLQNDRALEASLLGQLRVARAHMTD